MAAAETATAARMFLDIDPKCVDVACHSPRGRVLKGWGKISIWCAGKVGRLVRRLLIVPADEAVR